MNNAVNSDEQCVNNDFCPLHNEPMWGYCSRTGKKKSENAESENANAHPKYTLSPQLSRKPHENKLLLAP